MLADLGHAQTYYFTQGAATTATNVNTYSTDINGISQFTLGNTSGDFIDAGELIEEQNAATLIHAYITAGWDSSGTGNFDLDEAFPTFSNSQALWMNPDGATQFADQPENTDPLEVSAWTDGTWEASITFTIDDVSLYTGFFIEGQHYADDSVTMTINGHVIDVPSVNVGWQNNPPGVTQIAIDSAFLNSGTNANTITFTVTNFNPETSNDEGPSGLMGYGRIGATAVPEPTTVALAGLAGLVLFGRRRAVRA